MGFPDSLDGGSTDQSLMRKFQGGEVDAATSLYLRYAQRLQKLARYQTSNELAFCASADEIVQSVFRTFFRRASNGQYDVIATDDVWKLLLVITLNKIRRAAKFHRAAKRDIGRTMVVESDFFGSHSNTNEGDNAAFSILSMTIDELLSELPQKHREIVRLRIEGHALHEIAEKANRTQRTVERVLKSFRKKLFEIVES